MYTQCPHCHRASRTFVNRSQETFHAIEVSPRDDRCRRARPGQERAENLRIFEREHFRQFGDETGAGTLMPPVADRLAQLPVLPLLKRMDEQQHPLEIEDRIPSRQCICERRPGCRGGKASRRCRDDEAQVLGPSPSQRQRFLTFSFDNGNETAVLCSRGIIGVTFQQRCKREQLAVRKSMSDALENPQPGHGRSRAAPETRARWNVALDLDENRRCLAAGSTDRRVERPLYGIPASHRRRAPHNGQLSTFIVSNINDPKTQVELHGYAKRIEAAAEIGH